MKHDLLDGAGDIHLVQEKSLKDRGGEVGKRRLYERGLKGTIVQGMFLSNWMEGCELG